MNYVYKIKMLIKNLPLFSVCIEWYKNNKMKGLSDRKKNILQNEGFSIVELVEDSLNTTQAEFFVNFGSLLGLIRDGKFIEFDEDIDYGIFIDDHFTWNDLEMCLRSNGFKKNHQFLHDGVITEQTYDIHGMTVDFFGCRRKEKYINEYLYYRKKGYIYGSQYEHHVGMFSFYNFSGVHEITVGNLRCHVPIESEKYLASIYSENWRIPDPDWNHLTSTAFSELDGTIGHIEYFNH